MNPSFPDHFSSVSGRYADHRPRYPQALFEYLATLVPRDAVVWDCGAGTGQATADLVRFFPRIIATDASASQIQAAPPIPNVEFRVATAEQSGLPDHSVHLITVAQALHWFDFDRFYAEVRRVLIPDGVLAVWAYGITEVEGDLVNAVVQRFYSQTVGPYWPPQRLLIEAGYRTLPFPFTETTPSPSLRMEVEWTLEELLGYFGTWSATTLYSKANGHSPLPALAEELAALWGDPRGRRRVTWPVSLRIGRLPPATHPTNIAARE